MIWSQKIRRKVFFLTLWVWIVSRFNFFSWFFRPKRLLRQIDINHAKICDLMSRFHFLKHSCSRHLLLDFRTTFLPIWIWNALYGKQSFFQLKRGLSRDRILSLHSCIVWHCCILWHIKFNHFFVSGNASCWRFSWIFLVEFLIYSGKQVRHIIIVLGPSSRVIDQFIRIGHFYFFLHLLFDL